MRDGEEIVDMGFGEVEWGRGRECEVAVGYRV